MYYTRYSSGPLIVTLNQAFDDKMPMIQVKDETEITSDDSTYSIEFNASTPVLRSIQKKHKQHHPDSLTLGFIYTVGKIFKNWPKNYRWTASISANASNELHMRSSWERLK